MPQPDRRPIGDLLDDATTALKTVDPADTPAALRTLWRGFCVVGAAGERAGHLLGQPGLPRVVRQRRTVARRGYRCVAYRAVAADRAGHRGQPCRRTR